MILRRLSCGACAALLFIAMPAVAAAPGLPAALCAIAVLGGGNILVNTMSRSILQLVTAAHMRGRVMAIYVMVFLGGIPIGGPLVGWLCELWGPRSGMLIGGVMSLVGCAVMLPTLRRIRGSRLAHGGQVSVDN